MQRCSQALLAGLLLCIAGLRGENSLPTAAVETSTFSPATDLTPIIATLESTNNSAIGSNASSTNDTQEKGRIETVSPSGATVAAPGPSTPVTALPTAQPEPSSPTVNGSNNSTSTVPLTEVLSTAGPKSNTSVATPQVSQAPQTTNSTASSTSNSTAVTTNTTATNIQNSESPSSFSPNSGTTQRTGTTITAATTPTLVTTSTEVSNSTIVVSQTVSSTTHGNLVSTVSQSPAVDMGQTPATISKNSSQTTATIAMKEGSTALSSGSVAAITVTVIFFVLLIFGGAAYLKIRHSSYGRLVDDHDYGSWGNYNNPLYDDS